MARGRVRNNRVRKEGKQGERKIEGTMALRGLKLRTWNGRGVRRK